MNTSGSPQKQGQKYLRNDENPNALTQQQDFIREQLQ